MGLGLHQHEAEVSEVVTQQRRKISFPQQLRNNQLGDGDSRPGGSGEREREEVGDEEEEEEGGHRNKKRKLRSPTDTESDKGIEAVRENLAKVRNFILVERGRD